MIEKIENLDTLKSRVESAYDSFSQNSDYDLLEHWKNYLDKFPDQLNFCINVLLNKEKEKQYGALQPSQMHRSNSELFLRDAVKNLTVKILLHVISNIDDSEYFKAREKNAHEIHKKLEELDLLDADLSDNELADPENITDTAARQKVEQLKTFLATLPNPIFQSKRLPIILKHLSKINLTNINWLDKLFVLISSSNKRSYKAQQESLQEKEQPVERFLQPNETTVKDLLFLLEYEKLQRRYPQEEAKKRFARFYLWHCKNEKLSDRATGERYRSFLSANGLSAEFTDYLNVAAQLPLIKTGMHSADFLAQTEDSATVIDHQTLSFGEDMSQDEKHELLLKLSVTCCFANQSGLKVKTTETHQAFFVTRHNAQLFISKFDHPIQGMTLDGISDEREIFVILVSGNTPISAEEMKLLLKKNPLPTKTLSTKLAQEISTENGKAPIAISILPIDRNSKKLQYALHIPGDNVTVAHAFKERLEACEDFDRFKKLKEEVEELAQKTERYLSKLNDELNSEKDSFLAVRQGQGAMINFGYENGEINEMNISDVSAEDKIKFDSTIGEKAKLRYEVSQSLQKLRSNDKTALEKIKEFSGSLFVAEPAQEAEPAGVAKPTLARRIEATKTGLDYLKDIVSVIASGVAFVSVIGIIPMIAYRYNAHKWLWESSRGKFLDEAKAAQKMEATFRAAPARAA